ncbi:hypothetical protein BBK82_12990 [Lentzea guizhouensis]|uniref:Uncharacterized protein n=1 Tax=Lentzea guizhouensis TaxID=1586287 RepID=A0A1B2HGL2_9PSEU|nr:hypothetical protein [Lentzea guizhouensis]ANZ36851.1 hypothetical protein BBK82_12990 [Lentzea guizhouensis]
MLDDDRRAAHHPAPFIPTALRQARIAHDVTSTTAARKAEARLRAADGPVLGNNFDVNFGFSGMRKLAEQLRDQGKKGRTRRWAGDPGFVARRRLRRAGPESRRGPLHRGAGRPSARERGVTRAV